MHIRDEKLLEVILDLTVLTPEEAAHLRDCASCMASLHRILKLAGAKKTEPTSS
jgi:hypothetical protein